MLKPRISSSVHVIMSNLGETVETIVYGLESPCNLIVALLVVNYMFLQGKGSAAGATRCSKRKNLRLVGIRLRFPVHVSPYESQEGLIGWKESYLVKHGLDVTGYRHWLLSKSAEDSKERCPVLGSR